MTAQPPTKPKARTSTAAMLDQLAALLRDADRLRTDLEWFVAHRQAKATIVAAMGYKMPDRSRIPAHMAYLADGQEFDYLHAPEYAEKALEGMASIRFALESFRLAISADFDRWAEFAATAAS